MTGHATGGGFPDDEGINMSITKHGGRLVGYMEDRGPMPAYRRSGGRGVDVVVESVVGPGVSHPSGRKGAPGRGVGWCRVER